MPKVYVTKKSGFEACHHLVNYEGKCASNHGHSYTVEVTISSGVFVKTGSMAKGIIAFAPEDPKT